MRTASAIAVFTSLAVLLDCAQGSAASVTCAEKQATAQVPTDLALCTALAPIVRKPSALPLNEYQAKLGEYLRNFCHRDEKSGWKVDKRVRDTGPWVGTYANERWAGTYFGTHAPALVWYSPDMYAWLNANRPGEGAHPPAQTQQIPDGAMIVKEMYRPPAAACARVDPLHLRPDNEGAAIMVRDSRASHDGWFWGWFGWNDWQPDWPQRAQNHHYPFMGFGQYCTNCHASAKEHTFSSLKNIKGEPAEPLVFFSQNFFLDPSWQSLQNRIAQSEARAQPRPAEGRYSPDFVSTFSWWGGGPDRDAIVKMPSVSYDNVWVKAPPSAAASQFVTSDQCLGCHSAGGTGLQYDMTMPGPENKLINISPYGTWSGSPMGLSGRDPVFFARTGDLPPERRPDG
jgi:Cytochrome P460